MSKRSIFPHLGNALWVGLIVLCLLSVGLVTWIWIAPKLDPWSRLSISDAAACKMNQRNIQQAVRAVENMEGMKPGDRIDWDKIIGPGLYLEKKPVCTAHGGYVYSQVITPPGTPVIRCSDPSHQIEDPR